MTRRLAATSLFAAAGLMAATALSACGGGNDPLAQPSQGGGQSAAAGQIVVGSANFPESELLMDIYAGALKAKGMNVTTKPNIGSRETYIPGLKDGSINLVPEYTGVLAQYFGKSAGKTPTGTSSEEVYADLKSVLPAGMSLGAKSAAEDKDSVVVTKDFATKNNLTSIADLSKIANTMVLGGPSEWQTRDTGVPGLKKLYGLTFKEFKPLDSAGQLTVQALKNGQVQAANLFTTDPNIAAQNFVSLDDPKHLFAAQNVVPLMASSAATPQVTAALDAVSAKLDTATLTGLVKQVVIDKKDAADVADEFLKNNGLGG